MSTLYYWLGFTVFWGAVALVHYLLGLELWDRWNMAGRIANYWLWVKVFVFNRPLHLTQSKSEWICSYGKNHKWKMQIPRNVIARCIRYSKARGWKPETE